MLKPIYLDHNATTPIASEVAEAMIPYLYEHFGNPSSSHPYGVAAKKAVEAGYWPLYRFDPRRKDAGENPLILDSKDPQGSFRDFLLGEIRYASLTRTFPENADVLFKKAEEHMKERLETYKRMAGQAS